MLTMQIGDTPATVRAAPCHAAAVIALLPPGWCIVVVAFCDGWVQLACGGWLAYVALNTEQDAHA